MRVDRDRVLTFLFALLRAQKPTWRVTIAGDLSVVTDYVEGFVSVQIANTLDAIADAEEHEATDACELALCDRLRTTARGYRADAERAAALMAARTNDAK